MLGILDEAGYPTREMGILDTPQDKNVMGTVKVTQGSLGAECGNMTVIRKDGCDFCRSGNFVIGGRSPLQGAPFDL